MSDPVRAIADAVLYEGYVLWPYRRSALKNQRRFTFGGVYPPAHHEAHPDDAATMRAEVLLEGAAGASVQATVRFLALVDREVRVDGERVEELRVDGELHLSWQEAVERELVAPPVAPGSGEPSRSVAVRVAAGEEREELHGADGRHAGTIVRRWEELRGTLDVECAALEPGLWRVGVRVANSTAFAPGERELALRHTFCSTHVLLHASGGAFVSSTDPPEGRREAAAACRNEGAWPVLVGEPGERSTMLCSPIILEDHPRIAPESPGDLFDGGEIDGLLILNILALTDAEKAEMRACDPRTREILERTEALSPDELMALHGTIRELGLVRR